MPTGYIEEVSFSIIAKTCLQYTDFFSAVKCNIFNGNKLIFLNIDCAYAEG